MTLTSIRSIPLLQEGLPKDLGDLQTLSINYGSESYDTIKLYDSVTGDFKHSFGGVPQGEPGYLLRVKRQGLRAFLWKNLSISTGKTFSHYVEDEDGVTAYFMEGASVRGTVLVGSDGANSRVRQQLVGKGSKSALSHYIPIVGECRLPRELYDPLHKMGSAAVISGYDNVRYLISPRSIDPDGDFAEYYWALCFRTEDPATDSEWAQTADKQSLFDRAVEYANKMQECFSKIIHYTGVDGMITPPFKFLEWVPPESFPNGRITLIGDSGHAMIPFGLSGCNTAIKDAVELAKLITEGSRNGQPTSEILQEYAQVSLPRGKERVLFSRAVADGDI